MPADETTLLTGGPDETEEATYGFIETTETIAQNWKQILIIGVVNVVTGLGCLLFPVLATQVAVLFLTSLVFATGVLNVLTLCSNGGGGDSRQTPIFWVGVMQLVLAVLMYMNPFFTLTFLTFFTAVTFMLLGSMQIAVARRYRQRIAAKTLMMVSGGASVLMSIAICLTMPVAKWWTIGFLFGMNIFNIGVNRIIMGLYGRKLAAGDGSHESWRFYLDSDLV